MGDLNNEGTGPVQENHSEPVPVTDRVTTKKEGAPPVDHTKSGFNYQRGNFDTSVVTLLATINMNIVANTKILKKAIEEMNK